VRSASTIVAAVMQLPAATPATAAATRRPPYRNLYAATSARDDPLPPAAKAGNMTMCASNGLVTANEPRALT
jgi:hypothetical protein